MSGFDISSLPDAEQMTHLVSTLRKSIRRCSEIRREIQKLNIEYGNNEQTPKGMLYFINDHIMYCRILLIDQFCFRHRTVRRAKEEAGY